MCDLLQALSETADVEFEKCGEIIVAPKRGVYALSCVFCKDIFMQMSEFMRHMRSQHDDVLEFAKENLPVVYTMDELLTGRAGLSTSPEEDEIDLWVSEAEVSGSETEEDVSDSEEDSTTAVIDKDKQIRSLKSVEEKDLNTSIWQALKKLDVEPELCDEIKLNVNVFEKKEAELLNAGDNLNLSNLLAELESNDLTEISFGCLRKSEQQEQSQEDMELELSINQAENESNEKQKSCFKPTLKTLQAINFNTSNNNDKADLNKSQIVNNNFELSKNQQLEQEKSKEIYLEALNKTKYTKVSAEESVKQEQKTDKSSIVEKANSKGSQKSKLKNLLDFLDEDCPEIDNILDLLETSDAELDSEVKAAQLIEEDVAVMQDFRETTIARDEAEAMEIEEDDPDLSIEKMYQTEILSNKTKDNLIRSLTPHNKVDSKTEMENNLILKQIVVSEPNQQRAVKENIEIKAEQPIASSHSLALRRSPRKTVKSKNNKENVKNRSPLNEEKKLKNLQVKVQRLSPEVIANSNCPNPLITKKIAKNEKKSFKAAVDANRLKNQNFLQALYSECEYEEKNEEESKSDLKAATKRVSADKDTARLTKTHKTSKQSDCDKPNTTSAEILQTFKLPSDLKVTMLSSNKIAMPIETETSISTPFVKQNFSESSLKENVLPELATTIAPTFASSRLRQRKASIDIVTVPVSSTATENGSKTPRSNLDSKSYAVNRSARKKEVLKRMRNIKKQIFKAIEEVDPKAVPQYVLNKIAENAEIVQKQRKVTTSLPPLPAEQIKTEKIKIEKIKKLPNFKTYENEKKLTSQSLQKRRNVINIKNVENITLAQSLPPSQSSTEIDNLNIKSIKTEKLTPQVLLKRRPSSDDFSACSSVAFNDFKKPKIELKKRSLTPPRSKTALLPKKLNIEQPTSQLSNSAGSLEETNIFSDSVAEFLEDDLKSHGLNDKHIESILNDADSDHLVSNDHNELLKSTANDSGESQTIGNLLEQVINESTASSDALSVEENEIAETEDHQNPFAEIPSAGHLLNIAEQEDLKLLDQVGLRIIKVPADNLPLIEHTKASQFAFSYECSPFIWHSRANELKVPEKLNDAFVELTQRTNAAFGTKLMPKDLKRLSNLLLVWYTTHSNSKLMDKRKTPSHIENYLKLFSYIPKTTRRTLICEYCTEQFRSESKYILHRAEHTGTLPYVCRICQRGFKRPAGLRTHELACGQQKCKDCGAKLKMHEQEHQCINTHKCGVCRAVFSTAASLYKHSVTHLQQVYKCNNCLRVFAANKDLQRHMLLCCKREQQAATPRPTNAKQSKKPNKP